MNSSSWGWPLTVGFFIALFITALLTATAPSIGAEPEVTSEPVFEEWMPIRHEKPQVPVLIYIDAPDTHGLSGWTSPFAWDDKCKDDEACKRTIADQCHLATGSRETSHVQREDLETGDIMCVGLCVGAAGQSYAVKICMNPERPATPHTISDVPDPVSDSWNCDPNRGECLVVMELGIIVDDPGPLSCADTTLTRADCDACARDIFTRSSLLQNQELRRVAHRQCSARYPICGTSTCDEDSQCWFGEWCTSNECCH